MILEDWERMALDTLWQSLCDIEATLRALLATAREAEPGPDDPGSPH